MKEITIELSVESINKALKEIKNLDKEANKKLDIIMSRLADEGVMMAEYGYANAQYDGNNDVKVHKKKVAGGYEVVAEGEAVAFIEFGAGVTYQSEYPIQKPEGIVGIGEYGDKKGRRSAWGYYPTGEPPVVITHGNPASQALYNASRTMEDRFPEVAREVFKT